MPDPSSPPTPDVQAAADDDDDEEEGGADEVEGLSTARGTEGGAPKKYALAFRINEEVLPSWLPRAMH